MEIKLKVFSFSDTLGVIESGKRETSWGGFKVTKSPNQMRAAGELSYIRSLLKERIHTHTKTAKCVCVFTPIQLFSLVMVADRKLLIRSMIISYVRIEASLSVRFS